MITQNVHRRQRVAILLRDALARALSGKFTDHYLNGVMVSVTDVSLSPDLRVATCYLMPTIGDQTIAQALIETVRKHYTSIRQEVSAHLKLRYAPELRFFIDPGFANLQQVDCYLPQK